MNLLLNSHKLSMTIDHEILTTNRSLLGIANYAVGFNNIDVKAATNVLAMLRKEKAPNTVNPEVYEIEAYRRRIGPS